MEFKNKAYADFNQPDTRACIESALDFLETDYLEEAWPHIFLGKEVFASGKDKTYDSVDPNEPSTIIGTFQKFDEKTMDIEELVVGTKRASKEWNDVGIEKRAAVIEKTADIMEDRVMLISAALIREVGKSFIEAYAAVAEAIDFLRYDAKLAREEYARELVKTPPSCGDYNGRVLVPHGAFLTLDPFNFQVAIGTDQIARPLIMGNAVIASPSDKSSLCGRLVYQMFEDAFTQMGIENKGILSWAPGGADIVHEILKHSDLTGLCFTGSSDVLHMIREKYGLLRRGNGEVLVIASAETSGVDPLYIHHDADLEKAAKGIAAAACGLSGQKCSALNTLIVHKDVYEHLMQKVYGEIDKLSFGPTKEGTYLGAVITQEAKEKIERQIEQLKTEHGAREIYRKEIDTTLPGYNVAPTIVEVDYEKLKGSKQLREVRNTEMFGPVFVAMKVENEREGERAFNTSDFSLTGGVFTEDRDFAEYAIKYFRAGNFYINRKITGALVGSEPFGGLVSRSSLTGISAGSEHALTMFYSDKTISGFMPK